MADVRVGPYAAIDPHLEVLELEPLGAPPSLASLLELLARHFCGSRSSLEAT